MEAPEIGSLLPWGPPFLMIDRMIECAPGERIVTEKRVTAGDSVASHDEERGSWFPGVLLLEGMSQSAALLFRLSYVDSPARLPMLGYLQASLHRSATPGDSIRFEVSSVKMTGTGGVFEALARVGEAVLAEAQLAFSAGDEEAGAEGPAS